MTRGHDPNLRDSYRLLSLAARVVQRRQDDALAPLGLTHAAVIALEALAAGPLNQEQLAELVHVQSQTVGRVVARLDGEGLLTRTRNPADRRQFQVELTDAGKAALAAARRMEAEAFPSGVDVEGWEILQEQLARFIDSFQHPQRGPLPARRGRNPAWKAARKAARGKFRPEPGLAGRQLAAARSGSVAGASIMNPHLHR